MPIHAHPVVERLQGQVDIFARLQLQHGQPATALRRQEVDQVAIVGRKGRHLPIDGLHQVGVNELDLLTNLVF